MTFNGTATTPPELAELEALAEAREDAVIERILERLTRLPDLDAVRLLALGMAIAHTGFARKLFDAVNVSRAFGINADEIAWMVENGKPAKALAALGYPVRSGEQVSDAIIRILAEEDQESWALRDDRAAALGRNIVQMVGRLATLARGRR
jgi:hypothetical protein